MSGGARSVAQGFQVSLGVLLGVFGLADLVELGGGQRDGA